MASFWKRRKNTMSAPVAEYNQPAPNTRTRNIITSVVGIIIIGVLFFGVFSAARWSFEKLSDSGAKPATVSTSDSPESKPTTPSGTGTPPVTVTSSTSTTTPSSSSSPSTGSTSAGAPTTSTTSSSTTSTLPHTGPESIVPFFFSALILSYLVYRKKQLNSTNK